MKIEEGMYVRYNSGCYISIFKIVKIDKDKIYSYYKDEFNQSYGLRQDVIKASYDIIDLIKIGDYVNGSQVCMIKDDEHGRTWIYTDSNYKVGILENEIKSILTKEQFDSMKYELKEKKKC